MATIRYRARPQSVQPREAVEAFRDAILSGYASDDDEGRERWKGLHRALGLSPWNWSPLDIDGDDPPDWETNPEKVEDWHSARRLRLELEAAVAG